MMDAAAVRALAPGQAVEGFVVELAVAHGFGIITYRVRESETGEPYLLREYAPDDLCSRGADGRITTAENAANPNAGAELARGVARFLADAARAATVHHQSIARTIRGLRANGTAYQLLACPRGRTLADRLEAGAMPDSAAVAAMARSLLGALEFLHTRERLHGELSPGLIWVTEEGVAVLAGGTMEPSALASADDPYAPIEQSGGSGVTGPWTDIYRLAATLHHCLEGEPPPRAVDRRQSLAAGTPDPLAERLSPSGGGAALEELRTLVERGLQLDPAARPQSLREWRARISRIGPDPGDASRAVRRGSAALSAGVAILVLLGLLGGGYYLLTRDREAEVERIAADTEARQARAAEEAERWRQALEANAVIGYRRFIEDFPGSTRVSQALEYIGHLEQEAWPAVLEENTRAAFEAHLEVFPEGRYATEALARIEAFRQEEERLAREAAERARRDEAAWRKARSAGTVAALDGYLAAWPGGAFVDEARKRRGQLQADVNDAARFEQAREANTIAAYRGYVSDFPAGRHVEEALQSIDSLTLRPGKTFRDCAACPEMIVVPAGSFWQGSADASTLAISLEKPRRRVVIAEPFAIGTGEVTMRQWDACVAAGACKTRPEDNGWGRGERPVMLVSWHDAMEYAAWISETTGQRYSLPSESEWEYAARAGEESDWLGGAADAVCAFGNIAGGETEFDWRHAECADRMALSTSIAGTFKPNAFGLFDVIGNVAEWTLDCMNLSYLEAPTDGSAWSRGLCSSRMARGGSWFSGTRDVRLPARFNLKSGDRNDFTGFRLVRRVEPQQE